MKGGGVGAGAGGGQTGGRQGGGVGGNRERRAGGRGDAIDTDNVGPTPATDGKWFIPKCAAAVEGAGIADIGVTVGAVLFAIAALRAPAAPQGGAT